MAPGKTSTIEKESQLTKPLKWSVKQPNRDAVLIPTDFPTLDSTLSILLLSDLHIDNPECDRALLVQHLEQAKALNAPVLIRGDIFDAMQSRDDKRRDYADLLPELKTGNYFGAMVDYVYDFLKPYEKLIVAISPGNHETSVLARTGVDLISALALKLDCKIQPYEGVTRILGNYTGVCDSVLLYHHHGKGGGGKNRGILDADWFAGRCSNAHVYHLGHNHASYVVPDIRQTLDQANKWAEEEIWHVRTAGYHGGYRKRMGFESERAFRIPRLGGAWAKVSWRATARKRRMVVNCALTEL